MSERDDGDICDGVASIYYDGLHYDRRYETYDQDVDFYVELAQLCGPRVLGLATGTGRLAIPIAAQGGHVTGIDINESMLARSRTKVAGLPGPVAERLSFVRGDMVQPTVARACRCDWHGYLPIYTHGRAGAPR